MPSTTLSRNALYDLVWSQPIRALAPSFNLSDVGLRKVCVRAHIPLPERGHWAKLAAGKLAKRRPLPPRPPGVHEQIALGREQHWLSLRDPEAELAKPPPEEPKFAEPFDALRERIERAVGRTRPVVDLNGASPSVARLLADDERRRAKQAASPYPFSWDAPLFDSPFERRRLRIINAIARTLAAHDGSLKASGKEGRYLLARVGQTDIQVELDHPQAKPDRWGNPCARSGPVGPLKVTIRPGINAKSFQATWSDDERGKLETKLREIVIAILLAGEECYRDAQVRQFEWLVKRRAEMQAEQIRLIEEARQKEEARSRKEARERQRVLFRQARDWRLAQDIRSFIREATMHPEWSSDAEACQWTEWALAEADSIDPIRQRPSALIAPPRPLPKTDSATS